MGHRVLAIDFDPQCNLTDLLNEGDSDWLDVNMEEYKIAADLWQAVDELRSENKGASSGGSRSSEPHVIQDVMSAEDKAKITAPKLSTFIDKERQNNGDHTVFKLFEPIFQSVNSDQMFDKIKTDEDLLAKVNWVFAGERAGGDPTPLHGNFFLLRGSTKMADLGGKMGTALGNALSDLGNAPFIGVCQTMMAALADQYKFDFIVVDMSPSSG